MRDRNLHTVQVGYTNEDDGIWLDCVKRGCNWRAQVEGNEFFPTPEELLELANQHYAEVSTEVVTELIQETTLVAQPPCACPCHTPGMHVEHVAPCCLSAQEEGPAAGHTFRITVLCRGAYGITGDPKRYDEKEFDDGFMLPVEVRAWSLKQALLKAADLPFGTWFPEEVMDIFELPADVAERERRVEQAIHSGEMDGFTVDDDTKADARLYVNGEIDSDELVRRTRARHVPSLFDTLEKTDG